MRRQPQSRASKKRYIKIAYHMSIAVIVAGKSYRKIADRREPGAAVPTACRGGVDISDLQYAIIP